MLKWYIGDVTVTQVPELEVPTSPRSLFGRSKQEIDGTEWFKLHFVTEEGYMLMSLRALVVESQRADHR